MMEGDQVEIRKDMEKYIPNEFSIFFGRIGEVVEMGDECAEVIFPTIGRKIIVVIRNGKEYIRDEDPQGSVKGAIIMLEDLKNVK